MEEKKEKELTYSEKKYALLGIFFLACIFTELSVWAQLLLGLLAYMTIIREANVSILPLVILPALLGIVFYAMLFTLSKGGVQFALLSVVVNFSFFLIGLSPSFFKKLEKWQGDDRE